MRTLIAVSQTFPIAVVCKDQNGLEVLCHPTIIAVADSISGQLYDFSITQEYLQVLDSGDNMITNSFREFIEAFRQYYFYFDERIIRAHPSPGNIRRIQGCFF